MTDLKLVIGNKTWSSWSLRPWLLLREAGIPFDEVKIGLRQPDTKAQILAHSPSGKVPALISDDGVVWDSLAIAEYLADLFPEKRLWPQDPFARAIARSVSAEMHAGFGALRNEMPMDFLVTIDKPEITAETTPETQADIDRIQALWAECRARFGGGGDFLFGAFSIADAMYAPVVSRFHTYGVRLTAISKIYCKAIWNLQGMKDWGLGAAKE